MKKALIICAAGMSSSMMANKATEYLQSNGNEIEVDAVSVNEGENLLKSSEYDLYLISPQTKMHFDRLKSLGDNVEKPVVSIPFDAYIPIPMGIEKLSTCVLENIK